MENKYILACINGFPPSEAVVDYSSWLARALGKELKLFHTIDQQYHENEGDLSGSIGFGAREDMLKEMVEIEHQHNKILQKKAKLILEAGKEQAEKKGIKDIELCLRRGKLLENVLEMKEKVSVAVIGKYGKKHQGNESSNAIGHKVEALVRNLERPILIVSDKFEAPTSYCLAFDDSSAANKTLDFLCLQKGSPEIKVHLAYVGEKNDKINSALNTAQKKLEDSGFDASVFFLKGEVDEALSQHVRQNKISVLAMGAFGHNWLHDFVMGSVTTKILKKIQTPVLIVR